MDGYILHHHVVVEGGGESHEVEIAVPATPIPWHHDLTDEEEEAFEQFREAHDLTDEEEFFEWGDTDELPWAAVTL